MTAARALRLAGLAALCAVGLSAAAGPRQARADAPSPCRIQVQLTLSDKLVCPFTAVDARFQLRASCPAEPGGPARVRSVELIHSLPAGIRHSAGSGPMVSGQPEPTWRIEPFPAEGLSLTHQLRPILPGSYALGEGLRLRIEDDRGRQAEQSAALPAGSGGLTVSARCDGQRRSAVYLPRLEQPGCVPLRQPADIVLAVDRSTSLGSRGSNDAERHARAFLDRVTLSRDRVALVAFDQRVDILAPMGSPRWRLDAAIETLTAAPGTEIDRAIDAGVALLADSGGRRRVLVLITDGVQTGPRGRNRVLEAAEAASAARVQILTAAVGRAPDLGLLEAIASNAQATVVTAGFEGLGQAYAALGEQVDCAR
ncbi:MAG: VWA domain-containing protein [Caldilineae bacterium]|nr:VWA domain-containing protein [Caldilineae bacterium]